MSTAEHPGRVVSAESGREDIAGPSWPGSGPGRRGARRDRPSLVVLTVALALACSPLPFGYYDLTAWAPLSLGAAVLLVMLVLASKLRLSAAALTAAAGMVMLVALGFASILWAQSRDSAWTSANRSALYAMILLIGLIAVRGRATAWSTMVILGLPALASALVLSAELLIGGGTGAFLDGRLSSPIGYANGTAALLVMGSWPWVGLAERVSSRWWHAAAISAASLTASVAVLTQTRAIVLAAVASMALTLLPRRGRSRRGMSLLIVLAAVGASSHWTLRIYTSTAPTHLSSPDTATLRAAGLALMGATAAAFLIAILADGARSRVPPARPRQTRHRFGLVALALCAMALTAGAWVERRPVLAQWHDFTTMNDGRSANDRFVALGGGPRYDLWRIGLDEFAGDPAGGVGAGNYADQEYRRRRGLEHVSTPHSLELQVLAELGVGGGIGLLLLTTPVLIAGSRRSWRRWERADTGLMTAALGMFTAWLAGASVDWLYEIPGLTGMAMLAAAVVLATAGGFPRDSDPHPPAVVPPRAARGLVLGVLALLAASVGRQYVATLYSDSGQSMESRYPLRALQTLHTADQLDPWSMQTQYEIAAAYARLNDYPASRAALLRAQRLEPENYVPPALLGDIAVRADRPADALAAYRRALRLDPLEPTLRRAVAAARAKSG